MKNKGITLIALIITIIILLILAGVAISSLTENGLFEKAKKAKEEYAISGAKEELNILIATLKVEVYNKENRSANLKDFKNLINEKEELSLENEKYDSNNEVTYVEIKYKNYIFFVNNDLNIVDNYNNEENTDEEDILLEYSTRIKNIEETEKLVKLKDLTQSGSDAEMVNTKYNNDGNGIILDGSSSYGVIDSEKINITFPVTITTTVKWEEGKDNLLFIDTSSGIGIGTYNNKMLLSAAGQYSYYYNLPDDFFSNEVNYITVIYNGNAINNELYINGQKMRNSSTSSSWYRNETGTYFGRRASGSYFKGIIYNFKMYNKLFSEEEIRELYINEKECYENNIIKDNGQTENLILEYLCNTEKNENIKIPYIIKKESINKYDIKLSDIEYNSLKNGLIFNGESSYGIIEDDTFKVEFPNTITIIAKSNNNDNALLFSDELSKIGIGLWKSQYIILENSTNSAKYYDISKELLINDINYITVVYGENVEDNQLYLNGKNIQSTTQGNGWSLEEKATWIGRRYSGSYFDGTLYKLKIYSKNLSEDKILEEYEQDKEYYSNNN